MDHPNIAKVLDAGATEAGWPYFVMELVRGIRITDYCDQNKVPTGERLKLFTQVCQAIQHDHQKGVIHRDIKPSNVLVTLQDGVPVPKVIDFGMADQSARFRPTRFLSEKSGRFHVSVGLFETEVHAEDAERRHQFQCSRMAPKPRRGAMFIVKGPLIVPTFCFSAARRTTLFQLLG